MPTTTTTTTTRPGLPLEPLPDPLKPIRPPPRRIGAGAPRLARDEQIDGSIETGDEPAEPPTPERTPTPEITLSTTVMHRNRLITITATHMTVDSFCDVLDKKGFAP